MDIRNTVLRQLKNQREGFSLEQPFYIDPDYYQLDLEMIWYRDGCSSAMTAKFRRRATISRCRSAITRSSSCAVATS